MIEGSVRYSDDISEAFLDRLADGGTLKQITSRPDMPSWSNISHNHSSHGVSTSRTSSSSHMDMMLASAGVLTSQPLKGMVLWRLPMGQSR